MNPNLPRVHPVHTVHRVHRLECDALHMKLFRNRSNLSATPCSKTGGHGKALCPYLCSSTDTVGRGLPFCLHRYTLSCDKLSIVSSKRTLFVRRSGISDASTIEHHPFDGKNSGHFVLSQEEKMTLSQVDVSEVLDRVKKLRGLDRDDDLAKILGVDSSTVSKWKQRGKISDRALLQMAKVLGVTTEWLETGKSPGPSPNPSRRRFHTNVFRTVWQPGTGVYRSPQNQSPGQRRRG